MNNKLGAIRALRSWLDACGIKYEANGESLNVNGHIVNLEPPDISGLLSTNLERGLSIYHKITDAAGLGKPIPVDRGVTPIKKVYDDPILARFRHKEFRTAPDNSAFLLDHNRVIERECRIFLSKNKRLCAELGYEFGDLKTYAQVWGTTFAHRSAVNIVGDDNDKLLTKFLRQRFTELFSSLLLERRGGMPESLTMEAIDGRTGPEAVNPKVEVVDEAWVEAHDQIKSKSLAGRKKKASQLLEEHLNALGHDKMVEVLDMAKSHPCPDSRRMANRKLNEHRESCELCKTRLAQVPV